MSYNLGTNILAKIFSIIINVADIICILKKKFLILKYPLNLWKTGISPLNLNIHRAPYHFFVHNF